ncbi:MAG: hypothetical protein HON55_03080 [Legionellales bacterium]|jgi:hypothetical protein|nr:hypothetical protein [Legionellales bacterium]
MDMKILQDPKFIIISILTLIIAVISIIKFHTMLAGILCIGLALIAIKICYDSITPSTTNTKVDNREKPIINNILPTSKYYSAFNKVRIGEEIEHSGVKDPSIISSTLNIHGTESDSGSDSDSGTGHIKNLDKEFSKAEEAVKKI